MSLTKRILFGAAASWFSRGVTIVLGLVLLPVLFRTLPKEELGVWLLLGQSWATLGILDLGFGVTITRRIAFAKGKSGSDPSAPLTASSLAEIADLLATGRRIYRVLALASFVLAFVLGAFYLNTLELQEVQSTSTWIAWGLLCLSFSLTTLAAPWACLLQGVGYVGWDAILTSFVSALTLLAQIVAALLGGGLISLAAIAVAGALAQRLVFLSFARKKRPELFRIKGTWQTKVYQSIKPLALTAWLTSLGTFLVLNTDQFFVASIAGTTELPAYRAAYLILLNLNMVAVTMASASAVFVSHLWQTGDKEQVHRIVTRNIRLGLFIMAAGGACVLGLGGTFFELWLGSGSFIGYPILTIFSVLLLLEAQCYIITAASRATEQETFGICTMSAGLLKLGLSWALGKQMGLLGVALGTLLAQLATCHWFMVLRGLQRLQISVLEHVKKVLLPVALLFAFTLGTVFASRLMLGAAANWQIVLTGIALAAILLSTVFWCEVLDRSQKNRLLGYAGIGKKSAPPQS